MEELYTVSLLISIATFALTATITPGPNNVLLLSSGLTFGYKRTLPHVFGVFLGFGLMVLLVGLGIGIVFERFPIVLKILKVIGILYLFWMAYKIGSSKGHMKIKEKHKPFTFIQAALFQWVNPKGWIMSMTAMSIFVTSKENSIAQVVIIAFLFLLAGAISCNVWAMGGVALKRFIKEESHVRKFNLIMAILLVVSILPVIIES
ncbi:Lysine exporter protein (LYSE/YGGA) [Arcobacter nitrofigilis DSM 7299]|uniref:Lysine exporter protein (LYSE/YGGA) n=1 Tax=Arcobacter nitrofigilis (strain ATCC 33309 / DSM 7299 / CCUG 15893 / LMG 7604 / NCTC 12251 / CI) TaxID=572480 RepID=D5V3Q3_ARCNC|nr:LysE family translocator [Arcobacter nitrofigilis]ADG91764.1 Lysine exporter protein (LYSE/YGGA) [Arcobacter nitrofigilis DSM 7299]